MKLQIGKLYIDGLGRKVKIIKRVKGTEFCFIGEHLENGTKDRYKEDGSFAYMRTPYCLYEELKE